MFVVRVIPLQDMSLPCCDTLTHTHTKSHTWRRDLDACVQLAVAYFAYLRWAVTVPHGGGHSAPTGPAALAPHGPGPPAAVHTLGPGAERYALSLVAPLWQGEERQGQREASWLVRCADIHVVAQ